MNETKKNNKTLLWEKISKIQTTLFKNKELKLNKSVGFGSTKFSYFSFKFLWSYVKPLADEQKLSIMFSTSAEGSIKTANKDVLQIDFKTGLKQKIGEKLIYLIDYVMQMIVVDIETGEKEIFYAPVVASDEKNSNFSSGSGQTYSKRYLLMNVFGVVDNEMTKEERYESEEKNREKENLQHFSEMGVKKEEKSKEKVVWNDHNKKG